MEEYKPSLIWARATKWRKVQKICGMLSAILFGFALLSLFDGLQAKMRAGTQELEMVTGETIRVSGPCPIKNPVASDVKIRLKPEYAPISFKLEGFYTGYWFGSGMWRGEIGSTTDSEQGSYEIAISFKGASAQNIQKYMIRLYDDSDVQRRDSRSFIRRFSTINPFIIATIAVLSALMTAILTYMSGMAYMRHLKKLDLYEVYRADPSAKKLWCLMPKISAPEKGATCQLLSPDGQLVGTAIVDGWQKGKLGLHYNTNFKKLQDGCIVALYFRSIEDFNK